MVKPAGAYLDIFMPVAAADGFAVGGVSGVRRIRANPCSGGEGLAGLRGDADESLLAIKRAGASLILTYFAKEIAEEQALVFGRRELLYRKGDRGATAEVEFPL